MQENYRLDFWVGVLCNDKSYVKRDVAPCNQDIFAIRLMLKAVEKGQVDLGFGGTVSL